MKGAFERANDYFFKPLGVERKVIRKGHSEDNPFVERSHQTDDFEFYIPHLYKGQIRIRFHKIRSLVAKSLQFNQTAYGTQRYDS
jgi:hypothetical protein